MNWLTLLAVAVGLAMDAFAVSIAAGLTLRSVTPRHVFRLAFHFGLFQCLMPILGWSAGRGLVERIGPYDHWAAFGLLAAVGGKMLWDARSNEPPEPNPDPTRGLMLVTLSLATSIDALAVGMSMAFARVSIWLPSVVIGLVAGSLSVVGIRFGGHFGDRFGRWAKLTGGCLLVAIGLRILAIHLRG